MLKVINWLIAVTGTLYFGSIEVRQMMHKKTKYFTSLTNYFDLASVVLNLILLSNEYLNLIVKETTIILSFIGIGLMWSNFIYWLRIFESTTFYFDLISQTILDMLTFFIIFLLIVFACGNSLYILNASRDSEVDDNALYDEYFTEGLGFFNAVLNQFIVALGQGDFENYSKDNSNDRTKDNASDRNLVWLLFIVVSVFIQIVLLNMLIAIMGDTFDRVIENQQLAKLKLKARVLSDFIFFLPKEDDKFLFLATPRINETDINSDW